LRVLDFEEATEGASIAWNGMGYGIVWQFSEVTGTWFASVDEAGGRIDDDLMVTLGDEWQYPPRLLWNGEEFAFTIEAGSFGDGSVWFGRIGCDCSDDDEDGVSVCNGDCDDTDATVFAGAAEINDGQDNQCSGEAGFGLVDELVEDAGFGGDVEGVFAWSPQSGADAYEVARSATREFSEACVRVVTPATSWSDPDAPPERGAFYYLARALSPYAGSWGWSSAGQERTVDCGM
jgi:hypothetical protein